MSHIIIDRSTQGRQKSSGIKSKFSKRAAKNIKEAVKDYITSDVDIKSISDKKEKKIKISTKTLDEPVIVFDKEKDREQVYIGNKDFIKGDSVSKKKEGSGRGQGSSASDDGEGEDEFYYTLTHKEFLDIFFDGLELPDLIKKQLMTESDPMPKQAGYTNDGSPSRLDYVKTLMNSYKRTFAIQGSIDEEIEKLQKLLEENPFNSAIIQKIKELQFMKDNIPFIDEFDLKYKRIEMVKQPITKAVMFCILDVSGSMTEWHKEIAKRFFMILYLFLTKQYKNVELVFIKHHHKAYEVNEQDFFYSRDNGGTVVSTAINLTTDLIKERYPSNLYNVYVSQVSDGDNWGSMEEYEKLIEYFGNLLPMIQYFGFIDIKHGLFVNPKEDTILMKQYKDVKEIYNVSKMQLRSIFNMGDIYKVFRSLFEKNK